MVVIDLFSGAGGLTDGFLKEKYTFVAHVEKEKWACETLKTRLCYHFLKEVGRLDLYKKYLKESNSYKEIEKNREVIFKEYPELKERINEEVINKSFGDPKEDSTATPIEEILKLIDTSIQNKGVKDVDLIIGGPPCQAYSIIGRAKMGSEVDKDNRNYLFRYYKDIVQRYQPKIFVFENVPGILSALKGLALEAIKSEFKQIGYSILTGIHDDDKKNILDARDFGVNQTRKRVFIFGFKTERNLKYPDFKKFIKIPDEEQNTWNTIGDLPKLKSGEGKDHGIVAYNKTKTNDLSRFQKLMRSENIGVLNHKARAINKEYDKEIYKLVILAASRNKRLQYKDLPNELRKHKNTRGFQDRFWTHWWSDIPHTIVAHISKDGHYNIHPDIEQLRSITVREAARIQSFSDEYYFEGPRTWQFVQVGNAVPPLMSIAIAKALKHYF